MAERSNPIITNSVGKGDTQSRAKASTAHQRAVEQRASVDPDGWPRGSNGKPMLKLTMTAAELIPTGQYANVSVGPAQITCFVEDRALQSGETFFSDQERVTMAQALNELAEIVEGDVIAVQRNLVMESMQDQNGK